MWMLKTHFVVTPEKVDLIPVFQIQIQKKNSEGRNENLAIVDLLIGS